MKFCELFLTLCNIWNSFPGMWVSASQFSYSFLFTLISNALNEFCGSFVLSLSYFLSFAHRIAILFSFLCLFFVLVHFSSFLQLPWIDVRFPSFWLKLKLFILFSFFFLFSKAKALIDEIRSEGKVPERLVSNLLFKLKICFMYFCQISS